METEKDFLFHLINKASERFYITNIEFWKEEIMKCNTIESLDLLKNYLLHIIQNHESRSDVSIRLKHYKRYLRKIVKMAKFDRIEEDLLIETKQSRNFHQAEKMEVMIANLIERKQKVRENEISPIQIIDNQGMGDCFFFAFQNALREKEIHFSIQQLRKIVADSITSEQFQTLKQLYSPQDRLPEYEFMSNVETLEDLRKVMMTPAYYGDELAIVALENEFQIQIIVILNEDGVYKKATNLHEQREFSEVTFLYLSNVHYRNIQIHEHFIIDTDIVNEQYVQGIIDHLSKKKQ